MDYRHYIRFIDRKEDQPLLGLPAVCHCFHASFVSWSSDSTSNQALGIGPGLSHKNNHVLSNNNRMPLILDMRLPVLWEIAEAFQVRNSAHTFCPLRVSVPYIWNDPYHLSTGEFDPLSSAPHYHTEQ